LSEQQRERLVALLREETELMRDFADLTVEQAAFIAGDDGKALAASFAESEALRERFDRARAEADGLKAIYAESGERDGEIDMLAAEIDDLAGRAAAKNAENAEAARASLAELGAQLAKMSQNRKVVLGYAALGAYGMSGLLDKMT
jgi:hypothetical protein